MSGWLSQALRDENGLGDIAYGGLLIVTAAVLGSILFIGFMEWWEFRRCLSTALAAQSIPTVSALKCEFDAGGFGTAVGYICAGYAAALTALAAYMAATRRGAGSSTTVTRTEVAAVPVPPAALATLVPGIGPKLGTESNPVHVDVADQPKPKKGGKR